MDMLTSRTTILSPARVAVVSPNADLCPFEAGTVLTVTRGPYFRNGEHHVKVAHPVTGKAIEVPFIFVSELTTCCDAVTTFHDDVECCKVCFREVVY